MKGGLDVIHTFDSDKTFQYWFLSTALKSGKLNEKQTLELTELMATLNKDAAEVMTEIGVNACTDITGFGLLVMP
ncbi:MAG: hypothetical protein HXY53_01435 [Nitrospirae bacterium]|nr:hypothetical protein [Nitrospirota bacterium]